jgi:hypothetical protein
MSSDKWTSIEGDRDLHLHRLESDSHVVSHVLQIVAKATAYGQSEQLAAIEAETLAARLALRAVDNDRVSPCPTDCGLRIGNAAKLYRHCGHWTVTSGISNACASVGAVFSGIDFGRIQGRI